MRLLSNAFGLIAALAISTALAGSPALAALKTGAKAPTFQTRASLGGKDFDFSLAQALKKGPVVLYFFPAAFTKGCTIEAHEFAEATEKFAALGATVIGMAADPIEKLNRFSVEECRNKFAVGVATPAMIKGYDVALEAGIIPNVTGRTNRTSYVIAPGGKVIFVHSAMDVAGHVNGSLGAVKAWKAKR